MGYKEASKNNEPGWSITGHSHAVETFSRAVRAPAHAYLLAGPHRIGKRTLAMEFAKALNCESEDVGSRPCQTCHSCRLIERRSHPDVSFMEPEEKDHVSIDQVRALRQQLSLRPSQSRWRVVGIRAHALTESAADALLKTLEEPNPQVVLVLTTHDADAISETIVSRCQVVVLGLVATDDIMHDLERNGIDTVEAARLAALSYGAIGWAREAARKADLAARREQIRDDLAKWGSSSLLQRLAAAESLSTASSRLDKTRSLVIEELEIMMTWWRDVLLTAAGQSELIVNTGARAAVEHAAAAQTVEHANHVMRSIGIAATRINENVDPRLALEVLAVSL